MLLVLRTQEGREKDPHLPSMCKFPSSPCRMVQTQLPCLRPPAGNRFPAQHGETEPLSRAVPGLLLRRAPDRLLACRVRPRRVMGSPCSVRGCWWHPRCLHQPVAARALPGCLFPAPRSVSELPVQAGSSRDTLQGSAHGPGVALPVSGLHSSLSVQFLS